MGESFAARLHFVVRPAAGEQIGEPDVADLEHRCAEAARSWRDDFTTAVISAYGEEQGSRYVRTYATCFPEAYKEDYPPQTGAADLGRLEQIEGEEGMALSLYEDVAAPPGEARLKVYRIGPPLSLSEVLPILSTTGVEVVDERPYQLEGLERESYIYDFGLRYHRPMPDHVRGLFQDTVAAVWDGYNESDGFNALVLAAGLTWRQATLLRAYAKYMRQGGTPFAQDYIEDALRNNVDITRYLVQLFEARFDPGRKAGRNGAIPADSEARQAKCADLEERIVRALDEVSSLDHDRILRSYLTNIRATLRTNYFPTDERRRPAGAARAQGGPVGDPRPAGAAAEVRDLRLLTAGRGRAPALRLGRARRAALVRPPRRLPHRDPRPGQGADGEEHRDRPGRRQGRVLRQAAARPE